MSTSDGSPLPKIDAAAVEAFWERFLASLGAEPTLIPRFTYVGPFGDTAELADELIDLVLHGPKRATAGSVLEYEAGGDAMPVVDDRWIACDGAGRPRAVLRTTEVRLGPLSSVDDAFAWDEGEGDRTRADWLRGHTAYFARALPRIGEVFHDEIEVAFERFDVEYLE
ncbi:MAG: ASCH domain-containing protein [Acidimicrobiia bacterium]|nr:ASCH domain-containing protein [Acidimicrobiia bacterium]